MFYKKNKYRSGFEKKVRANLDGRNIKYEYECHKLQYTKQSCPSCNCTVLVGTYTPDFVIARPVGVRLVVEAKGRWDSEDRTKHLLVRRDHPHEDIRLLFQRDQPIRKGSKKRYSQWCIDHGIVYAVGEHIPDEWIAEHGKEPKKTISKTR